MQQQPNPNLRNPAYIDSAEVFLKLGNEYAEQEKWDTAIELYNGAIRRNPKLANAYYQRGSVYKELEKYHQARDDFDEAIPLGVEHAEIYCQRGYVLFKVIRAIPTLALDDYNRAIKLDPNYAEAYYQRGKLWHGTENYERAIEDFNTAIQLKPDYDAPYSGRGSSYYELLQSENAIADFTHVINRNNYERMHIVYYNRALAYRLEAEYKLAIQDYTDAIRLKPDFYYALLRRLEMYKKIGQHQQALEDSTRLNTLAESSDILRLRYIGL